MRKVDSTGQVTVDYVNNELVKYQLRPALIGSISNANYSYLNFAGDVINMITDPILGISQNNTFNSTIFDGCDINYFNMQSSSLRNASFKNADFTSVGFIGVSGCYLNGADFTGATGLNLNLNDNNGSASFFGMPGDVITWIDGVQYTYNNIISQWEAPNNNYFNGVKYQDVNMLADFSGQTVNLPYEYNSSAGDYGSFLCDYQESNFSNCTILNMYIYDSNLTNTTFTNAAFSGSISTSRCYMDGMNFTGAIGLPPTPNFGLFGFDNEVITWTDGVQYTYSFANSSWIGSNLTNELDGVINFMDYSNHSFSGQTINLTNDYSPETGNYGSANNDFTNAIFSSSNILKFYLTSSTFTGANFTGASFIGSGWGDFRLSQCSVNGADFTGATGFPLTPADAYFGGITTTVGEYITWTDGTVYTFSDISPFWISGSYGEYTPHYMESFQGAFLTSSTNDYFDSCALMNATFDGANTHYLNLTYCDCTNTRFISNFTEFSTYYGTWDGANFTGSTGLPSDISEVLSPIYEGYPEGNVVTWTDGVAWVYMYDPVLSWMWGTVEQYAILHP